MSNSISDDISDEMENTEENSTLELYVGKAFHNWNHVARFMKKYASANGHGVRIGGGGRVDKATNKIIKRTYLCRHAGKVLNQTNSRSSCRVGCPWKINIWVKKDKNCLEVTTFNNQHVGHECYLSAKQFVSTLRKLPKEIFEEIHFLTVVTKVNATVQYQII